uniref:Putative secreted protein n=1 Tax=Rhipicephalus microplus TaxID=6941 RepID=A0A6M2D9F7_RHIMP
MSGAPMTTVLSASRVASLATLHATAAAVPHLRTPPLELLPMRRSRPPRLHTNRGTLTRIVAHQLLVSHLLVADHHLLCVVDHLLRRETNQCSSRGKNCNFCAIIKASIFAAKCC